jgi:hypothetical protein
MRSHDLSGFVGLIYDTALDPDAWPTMLNRLADLLAAATGAHFGSYNSRTYITRNEEGRAKMKSWLWKGMLAATIALPALSVTARAQSNDNDGCTNATLKGDYAFSVTGWTLSPGPVWVPNFVVGIGRFDGKGNFTQVDYGADDLRTMGATSFRGGETGSYTVNPDCTGSQEIKLNVSGVPAGTSHGVIENMFVISGGGRSIHGVVAEFTPPGGAQPVSVQTRVDFWKVGSEPDN